MLGDPLDVEQGHEHRRHRRQPQRRQDDADGGRQFDAVAAGHPDHEDHERHHAGDRRGWLPPGVEAVEQPAGEPVVDGRGEA